jgi:hypothetical protein
VEDRLLTDEQVSELAQVSVNTVRYWRTMGLLPFVKIGRHPRIWLSVFYKVFGKDDANISPSAVGMVEAKHV